MCRYYTLGSKQRIKYILAIDIPTITRKKGKLRISPTKMERVFL